MRRVVSQLALVLAAFAGGAAASGAVGAQRGDGDDTYRNLAVFARILNYVENNYVAEVAPRELVYGAIRGMLATLDAHSAFMDPEQYAAVKSEAQGQFGGLGIEVVLRDKRVLVVERYPGSPAERAGLDVGDGIVAVDAVPTADMSLAEVVRRIKGTAGTSLVLTVARARTGRVEELSLVRDRIQVVSVDARRLDEGYALLKIKSFTERTSHDMAKALAALHAEGNIPGLVLDMRDNPGGLLDEAVRVADAWLDAGVIVSTEGRNRAPDVELAHPKGTEAAYPIVVLVNGGTASASEIVAGALQDHQRAVIVGTQSFGKGSVQTVIELEDHSALKLTIARYFTPKHRSIQGTGITPDVVVPLTVEPDPPPPSGVGPGGVSEPLSPRGRPSSDNQLEAALQILRRQAAGQRERRGGR